MGLGGSKEKSSAKKPQGSVTTKDKAVLDVKRSRDRLKQYQKKLEKESEALTENARALIKAGKKDRAMLALKIKKMKRTRCEQADNQLIQLQTMIETIEWESQQMEVLEGLKQGNKALDEIHKQMSVEDVEQLMDDTAEAQAYQQEIDQLLGNELSSVDEEACLAELAEIEKIEAEVLATQLPEAPVAPVAPEEVQVILPEVPTHEPVPASEKPVEEQKKTLVAA